MQPDAHLERQIGGGPSQPVLAFIGTLQRPSRCQRSNESVTKYLTCRAGGGTSRESGAEGGVGEPRRHSGRRLCPTARLSLSPYHGMDPRVSCSAPAACWLVAAQGARGGLLGSLTARSASFRQ